MTTKITVLVAIDQRAAIRSGIGSDSTAWVELDLGTMTPEQRDELSGWFAGGELRREGYEHGTRLVCAAPDHGSVVAALDRERAERRASEVRAVDAEAAKKMSLAIDWAEAHPECGLDGVRIGHYLNTPYRMLDVQSDRLSADWHARVGVIAAERCAAQDAVAAENQRKEDEQAAVINSARDQAARDAGGHLAERWEAGYATNGEVDQVIWDRELERLGLTHTGKAAKWGRDDADLWTGPLTDEQFVALGTWKSKLPEGVAVTLWDIHTDGQTEDGATTHEIGTGRLIVAEASWTVGHVTVKSDAQIGTLPDYDRTDA